VVLELAGGDASDFLNFVVKDAATGTWFDYNGSNFHVPLRAALMTASMTESIDEARSLLPGRLEVGFLAGYAFGVRRGY
jgi:hypothetical protein